jgi:hypothetical protein
MKVIKPSLGAEGFPVFSRVLLTALSWQVFRFGEVQ